MTTNSNLNPLPSLDDFNAWADYWYYQIGVNVIPADTRKKRTYVKWSEWQVKPIPKEVHNQWKRENKFAEGMAIIVGKVWRGEHTNQYLIFLDLDNQKAIEQFCNWKGTTISLQQIAERYIVEQHKDDTSKCHIYFYSDISYVKKSSDVVVVGTSFSNNEVPAFEVKGLGSHGIAYCTPSIHKNGEHYGIVGTSEPAIQNEKTAKEMMQHLDNICRKFGIKYLENDNGNGKSVVSTKELFKNDFVILEGHNRHLGLLQATDSLVSRNAGILSLEKIKELAQEYNQTHCNPPLDNKEFEKQWMQAIKFIEKKKREREEAKEEQETMTTPTPTIELTKDLIKEVTFNYIAEILSTSIKKDNAAKLITFAGMLLAQTNEDQLNLGFQAESSSGKSYIPLELASYFPEEETEVIASASPTAFYHDSGKWDPERRVLVKNLEHKNLVFLDQPHFQLLEKLRPLLSHDMKELHYKITDKNQKFGLRTKNVLIKGYPSVFFCSTKTDADEQEKTRLILLSPSTDQEKLRESLELTALRKSNSDAYRSRILEDPKRVWLANRIRTVRQYGTHEVIIPNDGKEVFDRFVREHKYLLPRHQRDFPRVISFIKAHALLNCFNRKQEEEGEENNEESNNSTIIANNVDIDEGFRLYKEIKTSNEIGLSPYVYKIFVEAIEPLLLTDGIDKGVKRDDIIREYYRVRHKILSPQTLKRDILPQLEIVGLIRQEPDPENKSRLLVHSSAAVSTKGGDSDKNKCSQDSGVTLRDYDNNSNSSQLPVSSSNGAENTCSQGSRVDNVIENNNSNSRNLSASCSSDATNEEGDENKK